MERNIYLRLSSIAFVVGSIFGLIISAGGLIVLWANKANVTDQITGTVSLAGDTLAETRELIAVAGTTLDEAATDLATMQKMIGDVAVTLKDSSGMVSSTADLIGSNMVEFVNNTSTSLVSVQNSARAVDSILGKINSIPLLGPWLGNGYDPDVPLGASVASVSASLDPLPESLSKISRDLDVSSANIATVQAEIEVLAGQLDEIQGSLNDAQDVVDRYQELLSAAQTRYNAFENRLPGMINTFFIGTTLVLIWIFITQVGMLLYGIYLLGE